MCHLLQGQKIRARATSEIGGNAAQAADGEVLFTQYGLSGTAVLDVSEGLSIAINREGKTNAAIILDLVPFMTKEGLAAEFSRRMKGGWADGDLAAGILPEKFGPAVRELVSEGSREPGAAARALAAALKEKRFSVQGTRGWNEAEFTCGGVDAREVDPGRLNPGSGKDSTWPERSWTSRAGGEGTTWPGPGHPASSRASRPERFP